MEKKIRGSIGSCASGFQYAGAGRSGDVPGIRAGKNIAIIMLTFRTPNRTRLPNRCRGGTISYETVSPTGIMARNSAALSGDFRSLSHTVRLRVGRLLIDFGARKVANGSRRASHPKELEVLRYLTQSPNQAVFPPGTDPGSLGPDYGDQSIIFEPPSRKCERRSRSALMSLNT